MSEELADLSNRVSRLEGMIAASMAQSRPANPVHNRRWLPGPPEQ
jgi:hypothetical protein